MKTSMMLRFSLFTFVFLSLAFAPVSLKNSTENPEFENFLSHFKATNLPFNMSITDVENHIKTTQNRYSENYAEKESKEAQATNQVKWERSKAISKPQFLPEALAGKLSRMGPPMLEPLVQFELNKDLIGVIYAASNRYEGFYKSYKLLIYNKKGEILNKKEPNKKSIFTYDAAFLVAQTSIQQSMTCTIDEQGHLWQNTYEHQWANDLTSCPIQENTLEEFKLVETKVFKINKEGKMEQMKEYPTVAKAGLD